MIWEDNTTRLARVADVTGKHITLPILCCVMVVGNGMFIYLIIANKKLRTVTNYFVTNLAFSDLLVGVVVIPLMVVAEEDMFGYSPNICLFVFCIAISQVLCSCFTLITVAVERYIAIIWPLKHHTLLTGKNAFLIMVFCWVYCVIFGFLPMLGWNALPAHNASCPVSCRYHTVISGSYAAFMYPGHFTVLWVIMIVLYGHVYVRSRQGLLPSRYQPPKKLGSMVKHMPGIGNFRRAKENWKALRILAVIVGYFIISWLPVVVWYSIMYQGFTLEYAVYAKSSLPHWFYNISITLAFGNSAINPFLYGLGNRSVRLSLVASLKAFRNRLRGKSEVPSRKSLTLHAAEEVEMVEVARPMELECLKESS